MPWPIAKSLQTLGLSVAAVAVPVLAIFAPYGLVSAEVCIGLVAIVVLRDLRPCQRDATIVLALALAWAVTTLMWTPDFQTAANSLARVTALSILGLLALRLVDEAPPHPEPVAICLAGGCLVAAIALAGDYTTDNALSSALLHLKGSQDYAYAAKSQLNRGATVAAILVWPLLHLGVSLRRPFIFCAAIALIGVISIGDSMAARMALIAGIGAGILAIAAPAWSARVVGAAALALVVLSPMVAERLPHPPDSFDLLPSLPLSSHHRLAIWQFAGSAIGERPWEGWGFDSSRVLPGGDEQVRIEHHFPDSGWMDSFISGPRMPLHPHNGVLQIWLELGIPGAIFASLVLIAILRGAARTVSPHHRVQAMILATLSASLTVVCVSYGLWQNWWYASLWIAAIFVRLSARTAQEG